MPAGKAPNEKKKVQSQPYTHQMGTSNEAAGGSIYTRRSSFKNLSIMSQYGETHFKILPHLLQDFKNVSNHFGTLCIKGLRKFLWVTSVMNLSIGL